MGNFWKKWATFLYNICWHWMEQLGNLCFFLKIFMRRFLLTTILNLTFDTHRSCQTHFTSWKTLATWWWRSSRLKAWLRPTSVASRIPSASSSSATTGSWPTPSIKLSLRRGKKYSSCEYPHCLVLVATIQPKDILCSHTHLSTYLDCLLVSA